MKTCGGKVGLLKSDCGSVSNTCHAEVLGSVFVNAQTDVFTSEKSVEYVQNFRAGRKENSKFWLHTSVCI